MDALGRRLGPASIHHTSIQLKHFLRWSSPNGELTLPLRRAFRVRQPRRLRTTQPIDSDEFQRLLDYAHTPRAQALLWTLLDSGFRVGEAIALNVGSVKFDGKGGATLRLPEYAQGLKTGPRSIKVVDCVGPLRAWLALHPWGDDPAAALFASTDPHAYGKRPVPTAINRSLKVWSKGAGIRHLFPYLFRHARATRAVKAGWVEAEMRAYFGWKPNSTMPSVYIHLAAADMEDRARRDAGIDANGNRLESSALDDAFLDRRLQGALRRLLTEPDLPAGSDVLRQ